MHTFVPSKFINTTPCYPSVQAVQHLWAEEQSVDSVPVLLQTEAAGHSFVRLVFECTECSYVFCEAILSEV